jgi:LysR family transcriptional regulator, low CO2-responsive transcriptional regulator
VATTEANVTDQEYWNLRVFCTVAEYQSVSVAATSLSMSQSGVSMVIHRLGQRYGAKLVTQQGKGIVLTDAGVELYRHALATLRSAHLLEGRVRALSGKSSGLVAIATRPSLSTHFLPAILVDFWRSYSGVEVRVVDISPWLVVMRDVLADGVEFAVLPRGGGMVVGPNLVVEPFHREPVVIVAAPDHPLAQVESPTLAEIAREPFIVNAPETGQVRRLEDLFRSTTGNRLRVAMEVGGDGAKALVRAGVGLSLMMRCVVEPELARGELRAIPLPNIAPAAELVLVYPRDHHLSEPASALRELIRSRGSMTMAGSSPELVVTTAS